MLQAGNIVEFTDYQINDYYQPYVGLRGIVESVNQCFSEDYYVLVNLTLRNGTKQRIRAFYWRFKLVDRVIIFPPEANSPSPDRKSTRWDLVVAELGEK